MALPHRGEHVARARRQLQDLVSGLLAAVAEAGAVRSDVAPGELAGYCLPARAAAGSLPSEALRRSSPSAWPDFGRSLPGNASRRAEPDVD